VDKFTLAGFIKITIFFENQHSFLKNLIAVAIFNVNFNFNASHI